MLEVPASFGDVTAQWLDRALREGGLVDPRVDAQVETVDIVPLGPGRGLIGDVARMHVSYSSGAGPESLIIKLPAQNEGSRRIGLMLNAYARELRFYEHVAPASPSAPLAGCYFGAEDPERQRWALVLEDCPADDFDFSAGATPEQAGAAVDAIADFHARWWQSASTFAWMPGFDSTGVGGLQPLWIKSLPTFVDRYRHVIPGPTGGWVQEFAPRLTEWSSRAATEPLTMVHTDYRIDNIIFDGTNVTIIDWQTALRGPAAMDLTCFVATSLTIADRRAREESLIDRYLDRIAAAGVSVDPTWFRRSYDENLLWWMGQFGNNLAHLDPGDDQVQTALDTMIERVYTAGLDHDVARLLG